MFGLIVMMAIAVYLIAFIGVVKIARKWAQDTGRSPRRWGWIAGLAMYLPVFWDHIPTVLLHRYLCLTEQGVWIYKTVEQWQQENPGVAASLRPFEKIVQFKSPGLQAGYMLNQRFARVVLTKKSPIRFLPVSIHEEQIWDRAGDEVMAKFVRIGSGHGELAVGGGSAWKFWLRQPNCNVSRKEFFDYVNHIRRQGVRQ